MTPIAANFHVIKPCNASCRFCFATFPGVRGRISTDAAEALITQLAQAGCEKLNFAGGEPTLHPDLGRLLRHSKAQGLTTSIVTNGFRLDALLDDHADVLDWVGLSVDSGKEDVQAALGRGTGDHVGNAVRLAARCHQMGVRVKLNSVITALTWQEDMTALVRAIRPERWKLFQVLPMGGQNDGKIEDLLISRTLFQAFVERHRHLVPVAEDHDAMKGSYVMVDPMGRLFGNATGRHVYSKPVLEVGVTRALEQVGFVPQKLVERGGIYAW
jgi:radical S-adenosyl methionine domain-containing protein 2